MNHHSLTLLMPAQEPLPQATEITPPASEQPAARRRAGLAGSVRFVAGVVANAAGFGMLLAGCWFSLQLMELLITPGV